MCTTLTIELRIDRHFVVVGCYILRCRRCDERVRGRWTGEDLNVPRLERVLSRCDMPVNEFGKFVIQWKRLVPPSLDFRMRLAYIDRGLSVRKKTGKRYTYLNVVLPNRIFNDDMVLVRIPSPARLIMKHLHNLPSSFYLAGYHIRSE